MKAVGNATIWSAFHERALWVKAGKHWELASSSSSQTTTTTTTLPCTVETRGLHTMYKKTVVWVLCPREHALVQNVHLNSIINAKDLVKMLAQVDKRVSLSTMKQVLYWA